MKRIVILLAAALIGGTLAVNGQTRKNPKKTAKSGSTVVTRKNVTPASDLPLFWLKGKVKKLVEKNYFWTITEPVYDTDGMIDENASKHEFQFNNETVYFFTPDGFLSGYEKKDNEGTVLKRRLVTDAKGRLSKSYYDEYLEGEDFKAVMTLKRNVAGEIISYSIKDEADPNGYIEKSTYTLRPDGRISKSKDDGVYEATKSTYTYDANGFLTKTVTTSPLSPEANVVTFSYEQPTDAAGNWLKGTDSTGQLAVREIEYYE